MWKFCAAFLLIGAVAGGVYMPGSQGVGLLQALEEQCTKNGNPDHVEKAKEGVFAFNECFKEIFDDHAILEMRYRRPLSEDQDQAYILLAKSTCKKKAAITKCLSDLLDITSPCMEPQFRDEVEDVKKNLGDLASYICDNDAKVITEFINDGALTCLANQTLALNQCFSAIAALGNSITSLSVAEACTIYNQITTCIVGTLSDCPKPSTAAFVSRIFQDLSKGSCCAADSAVKVEDNTI